MIDKALESQIKHVGGVKRRNLKDIGETVVDKELVMVMEN